MTSTPSITNERYRSKHFCISDAEAVTVVLFTGIHSISQFAGRYLYLAYCTQLTVTGQGDFCSSSCMQRLWTSNVGVKHLHVLLGGVRSMLRIIAVLHSLILESYGAGQRHEQDFLRGCVCWPLHPKPDQRHTEDAAFVFLKVIHEI